MSLYQPQNILLTDVPCVGDIKLCDFGLARPFNRGSDVVELVGTLDYVGQ
jgi:serine/threonine protein kinase